MIPGYSSPSAPNSPLMLSVSAAWAMAADWDSAIVIVHAAVDRASLKRVIGLLLSVGLR